MNILSKALGILTILMLICTIICGLWVRYHPQNDLDFHFKLSLVTVILSLITILFLMIKK